MFVMIFRGMAVNDYFPLLMLNLGGLVGPKKERRKERAKRRSDEYSLGEETYSVTRWNDEHLDISQYRRKCKTY